MASDGAGSDAFGVSVAMDGALLIIGAHSGNGGNGMRLIIHALSYDMFLIQVLNICTGAVYVYVTADFGYTWVLVQTLTASDGAAADYFGYLVAVGGVTIVVASPQDDNEKGLNAGVFSCKPACDHKGRI